MGSDWRLFCEATAPPSKTSPGERWAYGWGWKHAQLLLTLKRLVSTVPLTSLLPRRPPSHLIQEQEHAVSVWEGGPQGAPSLLAFNPQTLPACGSSDTGWCPGQPISIVRAEKALRSLITPFPCTKMKDGHRVGKQLA